MSVSPFPTVVTRAWRGLLLLFCLLAGAGCAARGRSAVVPTATPTLAIRAVPTFTPTATAIPRPTVTRSPTPRPTRFPTITPTPTPSLTPTPVHAEGVYGDLAAHHHGSYRLQWRGDLVEAAFMTTRSPVQHAARQRPQVLFTLPPKFRPPFPIMRRGVGQPVRADGSPDPARPDPRPLPPAARAGRHRALPGPSRRGGTRLPGLQPAPDLGHHPGCQ